MNKHLTRKQIIALLTCLFFLASILLSMTYIVKEADHNCTGAHCPICPNIQMSEKTIGQLGTAFVIAMQAGFAFAIFFIFLFYFITYTVSSTLITQNVRMNN